MSEALESQRFIEMSCRCVALFGEQAQTVETMPIARVENELGHHPAADAPTPALWNREDGADLSDPRVQGDDGRHRDQLFVFEGAPPVAKRGRSLERGFALLAAAKH